MMKIITIAAGMPALTNAMYQRQKTNPLGEGCSDNPHCYDTPGGVNVPGAATGTEVQNYETPGHGKGPGYFDRTTKEQNYHDAYRTNLKKVQGVPEYVPTAAIATNLQTGDHGSWLGDNVYNPFPAPVIKQRSKKEPGLFGILNPGNHFVNCLDKEDNEHIWRGALGFVGGALMTTAGIFTHFRMKDVVQSRINSIKSELSDKANNPTGTNAEQTGADMLNEIQFESAGLGGLAAFCGIAFLVGSWYLMGVVFGHKYDGMLQGQHYSLFGYGFALFALFAGCGILRSIALTDATKSVKDTFLDKIEDFPDLAITDIDVSATECLGENGLWGISNVLLTVGLVLVLTPIAIAALVICLTPRDLVGKKH